jgi:predicted secreted protein
MTMRRYLSKPLALAVLLPALCFTARARQTAAPSGTAADAVRAERLVGLAKVWGAVKYFHPSLAYREIDWDKALVRRRRL